MKIFTFSTSDPDAPANGRAIARILAPMVGRGGGTVVEWHPVIFTGATEEEVRALAEGWWYAEVAKARAADEKAAERQAKRDAKKAMGGAPPADTMEEAF
jgi:hypothetical protein